VSTTPKILVVDDTPRNVKLLADLLGVKGYDVITVRREQSGAGTACPDLSCSTWCPA
jgi:CheY-like chemotaxis protein